MQVNNTYEMHLLDEMAASRRFVAINPDDSMLALKHNRSTWGGRVDAVWPFAAEPGSGYVNTGTGYEAMHPNAPEVSSGDVARDFSAWRREENEESQDEALPKNLTPEDIARRILSPETVVDAPAYW